MRDLLKNYFKRRRQQLLTVLRVFRLTFDGRRNRDIDFAIQMAVQPNSYLISTGFLLSKNLNTPVDIEGKPIPWLNYSMNAFLDVRLRKEYSLFEYGSGYSTLFFSTKVKDVTSVEYDHKWFHKVVQLTKGLKNVRILFRELESGYVASIDESNTTYDIVMVDGRKRVECALKAFNYLGDRGVLILDDSERKKYGLIERFYSERGYRYIEFSGLKPAGFSESRTTIFYREGNCLGI